MRPSNPVLIAITLLPFSALAGPLGGGGGSGGGGGRGPLGATSAGIGAATGASPSSSESSGSNTDESVDTDAVRRVDRNCYDRHARPIVCPEDAHGSILVLERADGTRVPSPAYTGDRARFGLYAGAQKVKDSDGSLSLEAAVTDGYRFRLIGTLHHYFETQQDMARITMTMPTLMAGVRIDDLGATAVHVDAGVVHAGTKGDAMGNSSITGPIVGVAVEHELAPQKSVFADVRTMWFEDDVRANAGRVGVRYGYLQASFRVLDFNVGPPLYGPEVGVRF